MSESLELEQLCELIKAFPAEFKPEEAKEANRTARTRYEALDNSLLPDLAKDIEEQNLIISEDLCFNLCLFFHTEIFIGITSIAGKFRSSEHRGGGKVYFGGVKQTEHLPTFEGSKPDQIEPDVREAFNYLLEPPKDGGLENALRFYQKFVKTHPFYDGNGRVARLFVNLYLLRFDLHIDWKNLQDKSDFLNKLNYYHKTGIEEHFQWWLSFCKKYVYQISEEDEK